jgi:hypothetical protein
MPVSAPDHAHARPRSLRGEPPQARETYLPERVSTRTRSPTSRNNGTWIVAPVSSVAGLEPPPEAVSPRRPGSVWVTSRSTALGSYSAPGWSSM